MDNNPLPPTPPSSIPPAPEPTSAAPNPIGTPSAPPSGMPAPASIQTPDAPKKSKMSWIIMILVVGILALGGFYYYQLMQSRKSDAGQAPSSNSVDTRGLDNLSTEVESINVADPDGEIMEIDEEIVSLDATASAKPTSSVKPASTSGSLKSR